VALVVEETERRPTEGRSWRPRIVVLGQALGAQADLLAALREQDADFERVTVDSVEEARALVEGERIDLCVLVGEFAGERAAAERACRSLRAAGHEGPVLVLSHDERYVGASPRDHVVVAATDASPSAALVREILVAARLRREVDTLEERLRRAESLASLQTLLAGLAHNLNNPLTTVRTFMELLPERWEADPEFRGAYYELAIQELGRVRGLSESMMQALALPLLDSSPPWDLPELLGELEAYVSVTARGNEISLRRECGGDLPPVALGREPVRQALIVLLDNALAFAPRGSAVLLRASRESASEVLVEVSDQGPGVEAGLREKIFEPFYSTRQGGTGVGLSFARAIAGASGGSLEVSPAAGGGARFCLVLPTRVDAD
jgi:signal transduction histidine kinase